MPYKDKKDQAAAARRHYAANKEVMKSRAQVYRDAQRVRLREIITKAKSVPCLDCKVMYPPCVMEFDHVADDKDANIADIVKKAWSVSRLLAEISKCEVVCANCHRLRTWNRAGRFSFLDAGWSSSSSSGS